MISEKEVQLRNGVIEGSTYDGQAVGTGFMENVIPTFPDGQRIVLNCFNNISE
jgi:hypothetical protein